MHRIQPILLSAVSRSSNSKLVRELSRTGSTVIPAMKNEKEEEVSLATAAVQAQQRLHYTLKYGGRQHPQTGMKVYLICYIPNSFLWKKLWGGGAHVGCFNDYVKY